MWLSQLKENLFEDKADFLSFFFLSCFIWGKMGIVVWDSTSDSSEEQFQTNSGGRSICKILEKGVFSAVKCLFMKGFVLVMRS